MNGVEEHTFPLPENATEQLDEIRDELPEPNVVMTRIRDYVEGNPWQAIGIVAVIGLVWGFVSRRRG
jgi:ElaB/YqjD/DUF883 family membrane-anchored ribosome-binding protein